MVQPEEITGKNGQYLYSLEKDLVPLRSKGLVNRVFKGQRKNDGKPVIIKQLHPCQLANPKAVSGFIAEAERTPNHPRVPAVLDVVHASHAVFVVRDYVEGTLSGDWLAQHAPRKKDRLISSVNLAVDLLHSLGAVHDQGKLHADIRPDNLLVDDQGRIHILDWGQGFDWPPTPNAPKRGKSFSMIYSPPEQVLGLYDLMAPGADVYSVGLTLFEWITGHPPYAHPHPAKLINLQLALPLPTDSQVPERLHKVLKQATAKPTFPKPPSLLPRKTVRLLIERATEERYPSAPAFAAALTAWQAAHSQKKKSFWGRLVSSHTS